MRNGPLLILASIILLGWGCIIASAPPHPGGTPVSLGYVMIGLGIGAFVLFAKNLQRRPHQTDAAGKKDRKRNASTNHARPDH